MKTVIFGIDGAAPELVNRWINSGDLPNLKTISEKGFFGEMKSVIPPYSGPAWTSFSTGKNPGKHGIGDFVFRKPGTYQRRIVTSQDFDDERIWDIFSRNGLTSIVMNVPVTYPVNKIKGVQISGLLTPGRQEGWCYPKELVEKMEKEIGGYKILADKSHSYDPDHARECYEDITQTEEKRAKATKYLINNVEWDFLLVVFNSTDFIQHFYWSFVNEEFDEKQPWKNAVKGSYKQADRIIGELIKELDEETNIFVVSDHGFGPMKGVMYLNTWLLKNGYLKIKNSFTSRLRKSAFLLGWNAEKIWDFLDKIKLGWLPGHIGKNRRQRESMLNKFFLSPKDVDWKNTKAHAYGLMGQIFLNVKGRDSEGIINSENEYQRVKEELKEKLMKIEHPKGNKIVTDVYEKNEIYKGDKKDRLADLLVELDKFAIGAYPGMLGSKSILTPPPQHRSGVHRRNGMIMGAGPDIKKEKNRSTDCSIMDVAPTILHLFNLPIPKDIDGRVLKEIFKNNSDVNTREVKYSEPKRRQEMKAGKLKEEEKKIIRERLKNLGYVE